MLQVQYNINYPKLQEEMFLLQRLLKQWEKMLNMFVLEYNKEFWSLEQRWKSVIRENSAIIAQIRKYGKKPDILITMYENSFDMFC